MGRKAVIFCDKLFDKIIIVASLLFFLVCIYAMYDAAMVYYNANDTNEVNNDEEGNQSI